MKQLNTLIFTFFIVLLFSNCFSFIYWGLNPFIYKLIIFIFFTYALFTKKKCTRKRYFDRPLILLFFVGPFLSAISCYLYHGQSLPNSAIVLFHLLGPVFLYWILHRFSFKPEAIIIVFLCCAFIWTFLEIIQQFTYPLYFFASRTEEMERGSGLEQRNGLWRFLIEPWSICFMMAIYSWVKYLMTSKTSWFVSFAFLSIGIYMYLTRIVFVSFVFVFFLSLFLLQSKRMRTFFVVSILIALPMIIYSEEIFGYFFEATSTQVSNSDDDDRLIAATFYGITYFPSWICNLIGNGLPYQLSAYGKESAYYEDVLRIWRTDIGFIGDYNYFGAIYIIFEIYFYFVIYKIRNIIEKYQLLFICGLFISSFIISPFNGSQLFVLIFLCYLIDCSINATEIKPSRIVTYEKKK